MIVKNCNPHLILILRYRTTFMNVHKPFWTVINVHKIQYVFILYSNLLTHTVIYLIWVFKQFQKYESHFRQ